MIKITNDRPPHPYMTDYYSKTAGEVLNELNTSGQGLTGEEAELRLSKYGENRLPEKKRKTQIKLFSGTIIVNGRGTAVVTATGANTEIGRIAELIQTEEESTPLEKKLEQLSTHIGYTVAFVSAVVFIAGFLRGEEIFKLFLTTVSLAVAAIPEGLPIVVTVTSALGISAGSSAQIALFVAHILLFLSYPLGNPMTLVFSTMELAAIFASVLIVYFSSISQCNGMGKALGI